jgi:UPF0755 protein
MPPNTENRTENNSLISKIKSIVFPKVSRKRATVAALIAFIVAILYVYVHRPPAEFPLGEVITISTGQSLHDITNTLYEAHAIRYGIVFRSAVIMQGGEKKVMAGDYLLDKKVGPVDLAHRLVHGEFHLPVAKITIPEGLNVFEIADILSKNLYKFSRNQFLALAKKQEGYLFPDTYFIPPTEKYDKIIKRMNDNFTVQIEDIKDFSTSTHSMKEIITMASIVEDEARTTESRKVVAGILWKRLSLGMPLQVDSTFKYINGKDTYSLTADDLQINSPYNTYLYKGLPPTPINNPGVDAIEAVLNPTKTSYLYFLSSKSGTMYYAKTFDEHIKNKELYLNK